MTVQLLELNRTTGSHDVAGEMTVSRRRQNTGEPGSNPAGATGGSHRLQRCLPAISSATTGNSDQLQLTFRTSKAIKCALQWRIRRLPGTPPIRAVAATARPSSAMPAGGGGGGGGGYGPRASRHQSDRTQMPTTSRATTGSITPPSPISRRARTATSTWPTAPRRLTSTRSSSTSSRLPTLGGASSITSVTAQITLAGVSQGPAVTYNTAGSAPGQHRLTTSRSRSTLPRLCRPGRMPMT